MSVMLRRLRSLARDDSGMTLVEMVVAVALGSVLMIAMGVFLISSLRASSFTQGQSATMDDVRNAVLQIEKEIRGAESITWSCGGTYTAGHCLIVGAQTPTGGFHTLRYARVGEQLQRSVYDSATSSWGSPLTIVERVKNTTGQKVFACDEDVTLMRVTIDLHVEPTPASGPTMNVQTSLRPRNFPSSAGQCP